MSAFAKKTAAILALAIVAGCALQTVPIPPYLADNLARHNITSVASIVYQDENGHVISEPEFANRYAQTRSYEMASKTRNDSPAVVVVRLKPLTIVDRTVAIKMPSPSPVPSSVAPELGAHGPRTASAKIDLKTCTAPVYPKEDVLARHAGTVVLNFLVGVDGNIKKAEIATSSGYPGLDKAALTSLVQCHFTPAMLDGAPVEKWAPVTYVWSIS